MDVYSTHQKYLKHYILKTTGDIVEFGTGHGSTGFIRELIRNTSRKLISVENNREWFEKMKSLYPENINHSYIFSNDWQETLKTFTKKDYSIVFIDQSPWMARVWTLNHFKNDTEYIIIHDTDYFVRENIFGRLISGNHYDVRNSKYDFSDIFKDFVFYNEILPPTLVGSNRNFELNNF